MGENTQEKKGFFAKVPVKFWVLIVGWVVLGFVGSAVLKKAGLHGANATAWQMANFLILVTLLYFVAKGAVKQTLSDRRKEIAESIDTYKKMLDEARKNYEEIKSKLDFIEKEYEQMEVQAREDFEREKKRFLDDTKKQMERIKNESEFTAKQEIHAAEARLKQEAIETALKIAEEILKKKVTDKEEMNLFEEYLREVQSGSQR